MSNTMIFCIGLFVVIMIGLFLYETVHEIRRAVHEHDREAAAEHRR